MAEIILIGYGSVGRRHAEAIDRNAHDIIIIDQSKEARNRAREAHPSATVLSSSDGLQDENIQYRNTGAIIATWAPSHGEYFHELADMGVERILCEKPLSNSLATAQSMCDRAENDGIRLLVNHLYQYSTVPKSIRSWQREFDLGPPVRFMSVGGALGLINNGVHYMDLAGEVFGSKPNGVASTATSEAINPRSEDLVYYGGSVILSYDERREAVFSYSNRSSLDHSLRIDYRDAQITMRGEWTEATVSVRRRDQDELERYPAITRYGSASEELFSESNPFGEDVLTLFERAHEDLLSDTEPTAPGTLGKDILHACIGGLISSIKGETVSLPLSTDTAYWDHEWKYN